MELLEILALSGVPGAREFLKELAIKNDSKTVKAEFEYVEKQFREDSNFAAKYVADPRVFAQLDLSVAFRAIDNGDFDEGGKALLKLYTAKFPQNKIADGKLTAEDYARLVELVYLGVDGADTFLIALASTNQYDKTLQDYARRVGIKLVSYQEIENYRKAKIAKFETENWVKTKNVETGKAFVHTLHERYLGETPPSLSRGDQQLILDLAKAKVPGALELMNEVAGKFELSVFKELAAGVKKG